MFGSGEKELDPATGKLLSATPGGSSAFGNTNTNLHSLGVSQCKGLEENGAAILSGEVSYEYNFEVSKTVVEHPTWADWLKTAIATKPQDDKLIVSK